MNRNQKLDCRDCEVLLDAMLAGTLDQKRRQLVESHLDTCADCSELFATALGSRIDAGSAEAPDQTAAILARTSGSACGRAHQLLPGMVDGTLAQTDQSLLKAHLEHCPDCDALADALAWAAPILIQLGDLDPGEDFTLGVMAATIPSAPEAPPVTVAMDRLTVWVDRAGEWLRRQMARPRFSFEAAYVGTLMIVLLCGTPISPLKNAPPKALAAIQAGPTALFGGGVRLEQTLPGHAFILGQAACISLYNGISETAATAEADISARRERSRPARDDLERDGGALVSAIGNGDFVLASTCFDGMRKDFALAWQQWWLDPVDESSAQAVSDKE